MRNDIVEVIIITINGTIGKIVKVFICCRFYYDNDNGDDDLLDEWIKHDTTCRFLACQTATQKCRFANDDAITYRGLHFSCQSQMPLGTQSISQRKKRIIEAIS